MPKLTGAVFVSLDGVMQAPGGPWEDPTGGFGHGGWVAPFWDDSLEAITSHLFETDYDLLLGKRTYDIFAAYWPYHQDDAIGAKFQQITKYVATHSSEPLEWENSQKLPSDMPAAVAELKASGKRDLLIQGSSTLYTPLLRAGLIDRLKLIVFPLLLGRGKRVFPTGEAPPGSYRLVDHAVSDKGVIVATYEPAGEVETGSFGPDEPSKREERRRRKMLEGSW